MITFNRMSLPSNLSAPTSAADSDSDMSSVDVCGSNSTTRDELVARIDSLYQENRVLRMELDTYKLRQRSLKEENFRLRAASVDIQAKAEQEEEYISNTLLKKIQALKKEKEALANQYEREEEYLTNDLTKKLTKLRKEKQELELTLEIEQEQMVNKLLRRIARLEAETSNKQKTLEQLKREKVELENTLEQEQEALVNRLWKRMERLEMEKRFLKEKLNQSPEINDDIKTPELPPSNASSTVNLFNHVQKLKQEITQLKERLEQSELENKEKMAQYAKEEAFIKAENLSLQRKLKEEIERREALGRQLSESESSLEMEEERFFNEMLRAGVENRRSRTSSTPPLAVSIDSGVSALNESDVMGMRCPNCNFCLTSNTLFNDLNPRKRSQENVNKAPVGNLGDKKFHK